MNSCGRHCSCHWAPGRGQGNTITDTGWCVLGSCGAVLVLEPRVSEDVRGFIAGGQGVVAPAQETSPGRIAGPVGSPSPRTVNPQLVRSLGASLFNNSTVTQGGPLRYSVVQAAFLWRPASVPEAMETQGGNCACYGHCYQPGHRYRRGCQRRTILSCSVSTGFLCRLCVRGAPLWKATFAWHHAQCS